MTSITPTRPRVAEASRPPPSSEPTTINIGINEGVKIRPSWRTSDGPLANMKVSVSVQGELRGTLLNYKATTNERGVFEFGVTAGSKPTSVLVTITGEDCPPRLFRINIK